MGMPGRASFDWPLRKSGRSSNLQLDEKQDHFVLVYNGINIEYQEFFFHDIDVLYQTMFGVVGTFMVRWYFINEPITLQYAEAQLTGLRQLVIKQANNPH